MIKDEILLAEINTILVEFMYDGDDFNSEED